MFYIMLSACGMMKGSDDPEKLLNLAITGLSGKDHFSFVGQAEVKTGGVIIQKSSFMQGYVRNHNHLYVQTLKQGAEAESNSPSTLYIKSNNQWILANVNEKKAHLMTTFNPLAKLEKMLVMKKTVEIDPNSSYGSTVVLFIHPDTNEMTEQTRNELELQEANLKIDSRIEQARKLHLTDRELSNLKRELQQTLNEERKRLKDMLKTLTVNSTYKLEVDRQTNLPMKLIFSQELKYMKNGSERSEISEAQYEFKDYDKLLEIPQ